MNDFIARHYGYLLSGLIVILMVLCFLLGREEGRLSGTKSDVVLSCSPELLDALAVESLSAPAEEETAGIPEQPAVLSETAASQAGHADAAPKGKYVGSKNGTRYYTPGCPGTNRIKPENYIWFSDEEDATMQGYSRGSC